MNYGIGKIRPCGHNHFYKYAHCVGDDVRIVCANYQGDLTADGEFAYNLDSVTSMPTFGGVGFRKFVVPTPKMYQMSHAFSWGTCKNLEELSIYTEAVGHKGSLCGANIQNKGSIVRKWNYNYPNFIGSVSASCQQTEFGNGSEVRLYGPKIDDITAFFECYGGGYINHSECIVDFYAPSATKGRSTFHGNTNLREVTYQVYPISGNHVFGEEPTAEDLANVDENGDVIIEKRYSVFPKLSTAQNMFLSGQLNKDYVLAFINALENTYTDGKWKHPLYLGIHRDCAGDDELALALKQVDMNYITPIERVGGTLSEEVTSDKGWSLTVGWNGLATKNEIINPIFIERDISLPTGYTRCEYLEDTGTQWIDTGYVPQVTTSTDDEGNTTYTATTGLYAVAKQLSHPNDVYFFGSGYDVLNTGFTAPRWLKEANPSTCGFAWKTWTSYGRVGDGSAFESKLNFLQSGTANLVTNYGKSYSNTLNANLGFNPTLSLYLFSTNVDNASPSNRRWHGRIYRAKISEGTEIVRDFVPCLDANDVPCMYDILGTGTVEENTYYNANPDSTFLYKLLES